jgi:aryl-alcohol dehydrogenase-like predicted oxidoreductase
MEYRVLGRTGVRVSALALGTANFADPTPEEEARRILERAVDAGINLIDTGDSYAKGEAEGIIGRALKATGLRRQVLISTKVFPPTGPGPNDRGSSRLHVLQACEDSLDRLQTDYIDLYFIHRFDPDTHQEETLAALDDLVRSGRVRYIACSTHPAWRVMEALRSSLPTTSSTGGSKTSWCPSAWSTAWASSRGPPSPRACLPADMRVPKTIRKDQERRPGAGSTLNGSTTPASGWATGS